MSGHSKWTKIKHKKAITDQKRGRVFSKILKAISIAAREEPNPEFNSRLRTAIDKARQNQVPSDNIENAIKKASEAKNLEEPILEAYGPDGIALIIETVTDNKNRTISEIKQILKEAGGKLADPKSVQWSFNLTNKDGNKTWTAKFQQPITNKESFQNLVSKLDDHDDVQVVSHNGGYN